ncbi:hypothetical protein AVEN_120361-1 [Araneus ventricosus]|uniref:SOCS box domain-containing protein n=1 Tax=Araneus ventricosus TaxID=182803 RepID=A0A4Y2USR6_ARAVE|nr:hypothetical protein AVEN_120361-1 [Araneus ventricosus]
MLRYLVGKLLGAITAFVAINSIFLHLKFQIFGGNRRKTAKRLPKLCKRRRLCDLDDVKRIAKYSFIFHKSINHLDLSNCEYSSLKKSNFGDPCRMIFTEEGWRKTVSGRRLFYTLHLDIANGRERRLKPVEIPVMKRFDPFNEIIVRQYIYKFALTSFIFKAVRKSDKKVELLGKLMKLMKSLSFDFCLLPPTKLKYFMSILYNECEDSFTVKDFLTLFSFKKLMIYSKKTEILEYLMNHAQRSGYLSCILRNNDQQDFINLAFRNLNFIKVKIFFKFIDAPKFYEDEFIQLKRIFPLPNSDNPAVWPAPERPVLELPYSRRNFLVLQIVWTFQEVQRRGRRGAVDSLRLIWKSIPDSIITSEEFRSRFENILSLNYLTRVERFYHGVIGETPSDPEPRSLQHYCRTTIRAALSKNFQLPDGISRVGLPNRLQAYVRLEI